MNHLSTVTRPNPNPSSTTTDAIPATTECGGCASKDSWVLLPVRVRGQHRRLCTSCVLKNHTGLFCPSCFTFYDSSPPPPSKRLSCNSCSSFTHTQCAPNHPPPPFAFLCPPCADPNFKYANLDRAKNRAIDQKMATVLLCAAKISASSMAKAVAVARAEAERRVKEAAVCRKRAREALELVASVVAKKKEAESVEVSRSGNLGKREKEGSPKNGDRIEKLKSNGIAEKGIENGFKAEKNPSLNNSSHGSVTVKEEGVSSLVHNMS